MEFILRSAVVNDAPEIARLVSELGYSSSIDEVKKRLAVLLHDDRFIVIVATANDESLLGWVNGERRLTLESGTTWEIVGLVVDSRSRRLGVGKALIDAVEAWAASFGASSVRVRSNVKREESHGFYEANGYVRQKTQHAYVKDLR